MTDSARGGGWPGWLTIVALVTGLAAGAVQLAFLFQIRPFQADLGLQLGGVLLLAWVVLLLLAFAREGRRALWALLSLPLAGVGPEMAVALIVGCMLNTANCI